MIDESIPKNQSVRAALQREIEARGMEIFARMRGEKPGVFKNVTGRLMDWSMRNEALKVQLFRFVDVLPTLGSPREIARHAYEYLGNGTSGLPRAGAMGRETVAEDAMAGGVCGAQGRGADGADVHSGAQRGGSGAGAAQNAGASRWRSRWIFWGRRRSAKLKRRNTRRGIWN